MHANTLRGRRRAGETWPNFLRFFFSRPRSAGLDATRLEDRTLYSASPLILGSVDIDANEDAPEMSVRLPDLFGIDDGGGQIQYQLTNNSDPGLFDSLRIDSANDLVLDFALDQNGMAQLELQASDVAGNIEQLTLNVDLASVNDTPTMRNLQSFTVTDAASGSTVIDLFGAFDDNEDADQDLTFQVIDNSNASLFDSITIDMDQGLLVLQHAPGQSGSAQLTIVATDTGGLSVGMETASDFRVLQAINGQVGVTQPDLVSLGIERSALFTSWYFFRYQDGTYDYSSLDVEGFTSKLKKYDGDPSIPIVIDIENSFYGNTPEGRDRFAEVLDLAHQVRPDLEFGIYRYLPERNYYGPVSWSIAQQHEADGLQTWYSANSDLFQTRYEGWIARNELYRTQPVSEAYGGQPLSDMVDVINASLYTIFRNQNTPPILKSATLDATADRLFVEGPSFEDVDIVRLERTLGSTSNSNLREATNYYVVNVDGNSFQLAATLGGAPIDIQTDSAGELFVGAKGPTWENIWQDPSVQSWRVYAEENIAEARKFDKPIYAWISPSLKGRSANYFEQDFFRWQMEILRPLVDGIVIYEADKDPVEVDVQRGWYGAVTDFMATLESPAGTVSVTIAAAATTDNDVPVPAPDHAPVAVDDSFTTAEDQSLAIAVSQLLTNDVDADHPSLQLTLGDGPRYGTLSQQTNGELLYRPDDDYYGDDSFTYWVTDGSTTSAQAATVDVHVVAANDRPVAGADRLVTAENQSLTFDAQELLTNDADVDDDTLSVRIVEGPSNGELTTLSDGRFQYTPGKDFAGQDAFTYQVTDGKLFSLVTAVAIDVEARDRVLTAKDDAFSVAEDRYLVLRPRQLLANDRGAPRDEMQVELVDAPAHGRVRWTLNGSIVYVPSKNYNGLDRFHYRVTDGEGFSDVVSVQIQVNPRNDQPIARPDTYRMVQGSVLRAIDDGVLGNDEDRDDDRLRAKVLRGPRHGSLALKSDGTFVYRPAKGFNGIDSFQYRLIDEHGAVTVARANIHVARRSPSSAGRPLIYEAVPTQVLRETSPGNLGATPVPSNAASTTGGQPAPSNRRAAPGGQIADELASSNEYTELLRRLGLLSR